MSAGIENVSDTARWVAMYRAMESERPDAHFHDPFARRLAGVKGESIVNAMPRGRQSAWPMVVRTQVMDEVILREVHEGGVDLVLNLACGLDARAWRLDLPGQLRWLDVDFPGILDYKVDVMKDETPRCDYQAVRADLREADQRDAVLARTDGARRGLVVSEGLLIYLMPDDVAALARHLHGHASLHLWLTDLASPGLLKMITRSWGKQVDAGDAAFRFAPEEGTAFFEPFGWREREWNDTWDNAKRLKRTPSMMWLWNILAKFASARRKAEMKRFSGYPLLERV